MLKLSSPLTVLVEAEKPRFEVADIFRQYGDDYRRENHVSQEQCLAMRDIVQCRTDALGGHVDECDSCGGLRISYNSCRNRHCPKCGALAKAQWLEKQKAHLLPTHYFHVVFTIDHLFNPLARVNQRQVYNLLFASAAKALKAFGQKYLDGEIGFTAVLHTWGQQLSQHIHLHCLVAGGALSPDKKQWRSTSPTFLFPIEALSAHFRDDFCTGMRRLYQTDQLQFVGQSAAYEEQVAFKQLIDQAQAKAWQVYAKPPFGEAEQVLDYLGRYVQGIAISNHRLLDIAGGEVRFSYRDYQDEARTKEMTLLATEFMRRFLQHVLPKGFVRVRHYGFLAPRYRKQKLTRCRALLGVCSTDVTTPASRAEILKEMLGHDPAQCPLCGVGKMYLYEEVLAHPTRRKWQMAVH